MSPYTRTIKKNKSYAIYKKKKSESNQQSSGSLTTAHTQQSHRRKSHTARRNTPHPLKPTPQSRSHIYTSPFPLQNHLHWPPPNNRPRPIRKTLKTPKRRQLIRSPRILQPRHLLSLTITTHFLVKNAVASWVWAKRFWSFVARARYTAAGVGWVPVAVAGPVWCEAYVEGAWETAFG